MEIGHGSHKDIARLQYQPDPPNAVHGRSPRSPLIKKLWRSPCAAITLFVAISVIPWSGAVQGSSGFFKESPILTAQVEADDLPAVELRLPRNPVLVEPVERLGRYGGTWQMAMRGNADRAHQLACLPFRPTRSMVLRRLPFRPLSGRVRPNIEGTIPSILRQRCRPLLRLVPRIARAGTP